MPYPYFTVEERKAINKIAEERGISIETAGKQFIAASQAYQRSVINMTNILEMRQELYSRYPGKMWKKKVSKMPDTQVIAVYRSMQERKQREEMKQQQPRLFPE